MIIDANTFFHKSVHARKNGAVNLQRENIFLVKELK